jgi:spore coat polysaccharide biosynthesis protein SpsF
MKTGVIIQARTSSTRLPEKVLKPLPLDSDINILQQVIRRARLVKGVDEVIVATTTDPEDAAIVAVAEKEGVGVSRGSKENVLERYYEAAVRFRLDTIIRITSDCPCLDPEVVSLLLKEHKDLKADYSSNSLSRLYPHGMDAEVFSFEGLDKAFRNASLQFEKEHVTPYFYKSHPEQFQINLHKASAELTAPEIRITVDTVQDYNLVCAVYDHLYTENPFFGVREIIRLFKDKPWLYFINGSIRQKKIYSDYSEELADAINVLTFQGMESVAAVLKKQL